MRLDSAGGTSQSLSPWKIHAGTGPMRRATCAYTSFEKSTRRASSGTLTPGGGFTPPQIGASAANRPG